LKSLTSTYLICKECFDLKNYPKILTAADFEKSSLQSLLTMPALSDDDQAGAAENDEAEVAQNTPWTNDEVI
jgi:hypothetical protein